MTGCPPAQKPGGLCSRATEGRRTPTGGLACDNVLRVNCGPSPLLLGVELRHLLGRSCGTPLLLRHPPPRKELRRRIFERCLYVVWPAACLADFARRTRFPELGSDDDRRLALPDQLQNFGILFWRPRFCNQRSSAGSCARHVDCPSRRRCARPRACIRDRRTSVARRNRRVRNGACA